LSSSSTDLILGNERLYPRKVATAMAKHPATQVLAPSLTPMLDFVVVVADVVPDTLAALPLVGV
jgi:hypothetical protein